MTRPHAASRTWATTVLVLAGLAACQDTALLAPAPSGPTTPVPAKGAALQIALDCRAKVAARTLTCQPSPGAAQVLPAGISAALIIGGQNNYLTLAQVGTSYDDANGVLASAITVKNLISQPMGTTDGTTIDPNGVRVFFHTLPIVTAGTGAVTVRNADGTGTFTASGQPYFTYQEIITGNATSTPKTWMFNLPLSVDEFTFQVYVQASLKNEGSLEGQPVHAFSGQLVAGSTATCAMRSSAGVYCWGGNVNGTLGTPAGQQAYRPYSAAVGPEFTSITTAEDGNHTCGLTSVGSVYCWGVNSNGQVGDGTTTQRLTPTATTMPASVTFTQIFNGANDTCALTSAGAAYCWGNNGNAQLGDGTTTSRSTPTAVATPIGITFASLAVGSNHTCGLTSDGVAYCWGYNGYGELGDGTATQQPTPTMTLSSGVIFASLTAGAYHTCALTPDGAAYCWGYNAEGELGDGTTTNRSTPTAVTMPIGVTFAKLTSGPFFTCGLSTTGAAYCWGDDSNGQLGDGATANRSIPTAAATPGGITFATITSGSIHACGLTAAGAAYCWGYNGNGRLGDGTVVNHGTPAAVSMPAGVTFTGLVAGSSHTCGLTAGGDSYCWGYNGNGQLGNLIVTTTSFTGPLLALNTSDLTQIAMGASAQHVCGVTSLGAAYCWGYNFNGQQGDGSVTTHSRATPVTLPGVTFASVGEGTNHTCGLTSAGAAYCWGANGSGQLGDGTVAGRTTPTAVTMPSGIAFASVAGGGSHTCALTSAGTVYCWGTNGSGQLGDGTTFGRLTPTAVTMPSGVTFASLAMGTNHTCGLATSGAAYCWGVNSNGQDGDNTLLARNVPTAVKMPLSVTFASIAAGANHTCGRSSAGATYCWGLNSSGQLGDGTPTRRLAPTATTLPSGVTLASLAAGASHTCGMTSAGAVYCWGSNGSGQLGDGTQTLRNVPTLSLTP